MKPETRRERRGKRSRIEPGVAVPQLAQPAVDLAAPAAGADDAVDLRLRRRAHPQPQAVVGEDLQLLDVVGGPAGGQRMHAAGVVADHAADRAPAVGGGIGAEGEPVPESRRGGGRRAPCRGGRGRSAARDRSRARRSDGGRSRSPPPRCSTARRGWCPRRGGRSARHAAGRPPPPRSGPRRPPAPRPRSAPAGSSRRRWRRGRGCPASKRTSPRRERRRSSARAVESPGQFIEGGYPRSDAFVSVVSSSKSWIQPNGEIGLREL